MFRTAVFLQDAPEWSIYDREWMTWDLKDSLVIESHKWCYLQNCQKNSPTPCRLFPYLRDLKLSRRSADICKVLSINKALEYALPCAQYVKGSAELYENAVQLYEAAVKLELR